MAAEEEAGELHRVLFVKALKATQEWWHNLPCPKDHHAGDQGSTYESGEAADANGLLAHPATVPLDTHHPTENKSPQNLLHTLTASQTRGAAWCAQNSLGIRSNEALIKRTT